MNVAGPALTSRDVALKVTVRSGGTVTAAREIAMLKPFTGVTVTVDKPVAPAWRVRCVGSDETSKSAVGTQLVGLVETAWAGRGAKKHSPRISIMKRILVIIGRLLRE